jgi:hypothetical protein
MLFVARMDIEQCSKRGLGRVDWIVLEQRLDVTGDAMSALIKHLSGADVVVDVLFFSGDPAIDQTNPKDVLFEASSAISSWFVAPTQCWGRGLVKFPCTNPWEWRRTTFLRTR